MKKILLRILEVVKQFSKSILSMKPLIILMTLVHAFLNLLLIVLEQMIFYNNHILLCTFLKFVVKVLVFIVQIKSISFLIFLYDIMIMNYEYQKEDIEDNDYLKGLAGIILKGLFLNIISYQLGILVSESIVIISI